MIFDFASTATPAVGWLNSNSAAVQAFATAVLVVITIISTRLTKKAVKEAEKARKDSRLPIIEVELSGPMKGRDDKKWISITLNNVGNGLASDLVLSVPRRGPLVLDASLAVGNSVSQRIELENDEDKAIMNMSAKKRLIKVQYTDVFNRKIQTIAWIEQDRPVQWIEITVKKWKLCLPK